MKKKETSKLDKKRICKYVLICPEECLHKEPHSIAYIIETDVHVERAEAEKFLERADRKRVYDCSLSFNCPISSGGKLYNSRCMLLDRSKK